MPYKLAIEHDIKRQAPYVKRLVDDIKSEDEAKLKASGYTSEMLETFLEGEKYDLDHLRKLASAAGVPYERLVTAIALKKIV